jgi:methionyl-tRNA formyltransferase
VRVLVLTSLRTGLASRCLPELCASPKLEVVGVVLARRPAPNPWRSFKKRLRKTARIGILGAINGLRLRAWYAAETEPIDTVAARCHIDLLETPSINCDETVSVVRSLRADLGLSLGNSYISERVFSVPRHGMINVHGEILPDYQGALSIIWPIYEGKTETGFTIHQINKRIDTGEILLQRRYPITFHESLKETVMRNLSTIRHDVPPAVRFVCEHYSELTGRAQKQEGGRCFTTPTFWQFLRMLRNHRRLWRDSQPVLATR